MAELISIYQWLIAHEADLVNIITGILGVATVVVRLTPTEKDDNLVHRIGDLVDKVLDFLHIPNNKAGGGQHE